MQVPGPRLRVASLWQPQPLQLTVDSSATQGARGEGTGMRTQSLCLALFFAVSASRKTFGEGR